VALVEDTRNMVVILVFKTWIK